MRWSSGPVQRSSACFANSSFAASGAGASIQATRYPGASVFFHDEQMYPEAQGFWTMGAHSVQVTVAVPPAQTSTPVTLRMHPGAKPNAVTISTFGWQHYVEMVPGHAVEVELPMFPSGVVPLTIATEL